jgi:nucleotide-binding universal stress UspA family protein
MTVSLMHELEAATGTPERVLVVFERSANGRAALGYALEQTRGTDVELTVLNAMPYERVDVGCARCRHSAAIWNREMRYDAEQALAQAGELVAEHPAVTYAVAKGQAAQPIAQAAERMGVDLIILPARPAHRLRAFGFAALAERLDPRGGWDVTFAPGATERQTGRGRAKPGAEWRRLRLAAVFFVACWALLVGLTVIGFY